VLCGAFRSIFAAIAIGTDACNPDTAGNVFLKIHGPDLWVYAAC
jgi:hypothetical protein